jgi:hypothetical protein
MWISNINAVSLGSQSVIQFSVFGLINSKQAQATDSFIITTMTGDQAVLFDTASSGLTVTNDCDWPCL